MQTFSQTLLLVAAALSLTSAAPLEEQKGHSFTVHQVRNPKHVKNGALALAKAYRKYGAPFPEYLTTALNNQTSANTKRATTGSAATTPEEYDIEYLTPVSIGTPAQTLNLDFDTGSADLWVFSTELASRYQTGHSVYNPSKSSTAKKLSGSSWDISYGDGSGASGDVYTDVVNIGGVSFASQAVEAASTISTEFTEDTNNDGLVGLAFSSINTVSPTSQKTFFDNVKSSLSQPLFAANLKHDTPGSYDFGFTDSSQYTGSIAYTSVSSSQGFWQFTASSYKVGSTSYNTKVSGIADTGTTLLLLPDTIVKNYYSKVSGAQNSNTYGGYVFPCSATLPTFTYVVGTTSIVIPATYMNYAPVTDGSSTCYGGLQSSTGIGINIFGDIALKAAYVVFNGGSTPQLGFAAKST
ncbi:aspartic peptidase domain-containing protein [Biscogniauxia mediterranea]|nr:aspartic peptidase domain-containing protein [Biscogniauxia mediterranea]